MAVTSTETGTHYNKSISRHQNWRIAVAFFDAAFPNDRNTSTQTASDWVSFGHLHSTLEEWLERELAAQAKWRRF